MFDRVDLLKEFVEAAGISGSEQKTAALIIKLATPLADECYKDAMGNVICHKKGNGKRLLFTAHMDNVGFFVRGADSKGNVLVEFTGGVNNNSFWNRPVRFNNGTMGILRSVKSNAGSKKADQITADDIFVEIGAESYEEAMRMVSIGESCVWEGDTFRCGNSYIQSPYIDDAIGCITLLQMLEKLQDCPNDLWFAFTVCEEIGSYGAKTVAYAIDCDYAFSVDVSPATDTPSSSATSYTLALGKGPALILREYGFIANPVFRNRFAELAERNSIPYQAKISRGGTDAASIVTTKSGVPTLSIGIPHRYIHTPNEMVCEKDLDATCALLCAFASENL